MTRLGIVLLAVVLVAGPRTSGAQIRSIARQAIRQGSIKRDVPPKLLAEAKVSEDSAKAIALAKVPNGKIQELALEREDGKLIWSLVLKVAGKSGVEEVNVSAMDGSIVATEHEPDGQAAKEEAAGTAKAAPKKKP